KMAPGSETFVQFRLEGPVVVARGDRFIVRTYSPARTIGGGTVLDANPTKRKGAGRSDLGFLAVAEAGDRGEMIRSVLRSSRKGAVPIAEVARRLQILDAEALEALRALEAVGEVRFLGQGVLLEETASALEAEIEERMRDASVRDPLRAGIPREEIRRSLSREVDLPLFQVLLGEMAKAGKATLRGEIVLAGGGALPERFRRLAERVEAILEKHRLAPPLPAQLAEEAGAGAKELQTVLDLLARFGRVVKVAPALVYRTAEIEEIRSVLRAALKEKGALSVSDFKERTGVSRKYAVPLLEHFDRERWTRREGDLRVPGPAFVEE
ncbi:MAG: SelB C-terminal domain-containing protein, partial [Candidatus Eisenbacteria bacterium]